MDSFCSRCGQQAELYASPDGSMYCQSCIIQTKPVCIDCIKCHQRRCGDAVYACPLCTHGDGESARIFEKEVKRVEPLRIEEKCERCGGPMHRAFILHGRALCRDCLIYEQDRWEIVTAKPGGTGTRVKIVIHPPKMPAAEEPAKQVRVAKKVFHLIGADLRSLPSDPLFTRFSGAKTLGERRMPDDRCVNCEAYAAGRKRAKFLGDYELHGRK